MSLVDITYEIHCSYCSKVEVQKHCYSFNQEIPKPFLPWYWHKIDGKLMCRDHILYLKNENDYVPFT